MSHPYTYEMIFHERHQALVSEAEHGRLVALARRARSRRIKAERRARRLESAPTPTVVVPQQRTAEQSEEREPVKVA
jgi:hypothetical protein